MIVVITNDLLKEELLAQGIADNTAIQCIKEPAIIAEASCYIDLLFDDSNARINLLKGLNAELIIVTAVNIKCADLPENFIRINGWPTFLSRTLIEAATTNKELKIKAEAVIGYFNKTIEWTPDIIGFISPRVISMLVNEAYYTISDKVTGKAEIDTAMKLGTKYPFGPFEWSEKIGVNNIYKLLLKLSVEQKRYEPCDLLKQDAFQ